MDGGGSNDRKEGIRKEEGRMPYSLFPTGLKMGVQPAMPYQQPTKFAKLAYIESLLPFLKPALQVSNVPEAFWGSHSGSSGS